MTRIVLDASVAVAAAVDRNGDGTWARGILADARICAPHVLPVEITSALRRGVASRELSPDGAALALGDLLALDTELFAFDMAADRVWELRTSVSPYDAWYVALAELLELPLVTLDRKLARAKGPTCEFVTP